MDVIFCGELAFMDGSRWRGLTKDRGFAVERERWSIAIFLAIAVGLTYYTVGK